MSYKQMASALNNSHSLLRHWYPQRDAMQWVLAIIYKTQGSAYRKAGSMMLFNDQGQYFGILSGGCLESDLHKRAMRVLHEGTAITHRYDSTERDSDAYQLGLGCGGVVEVLLQPINSANHYLNLERALDYLNDGQIVCLNARLDRQELLVTPIVQPIKGQPIKGQPIEAQLIDGEEGRYFQYCIQPIAQLLVFGGGVDARPLVAMAAQMGLQVTLLDPRVTNARPEFFGSASRIDRTDPSQLSGADWLPAIDAVVIMMHDNELDAAALTAVSALTLKYCALLGPMHRKNEVLELAGIAESSLAFKLHAPAGLNIEALLPEEIAVSILAQYLAVR